MAPEYHDLVEALRKGQVWDDDEQAYWPRCPNHKLIEYNIPVYDFGHLFDPDSPFFAPNGILEMLEEAALDMGLIDPDGSSSSYERMKPPHERYAIKFSTGDESCMVALVNGARRNENGIYVLDIHPYSYEGAGWFIHGDYNQGGFQKVLWWALLSLKVWHEDTEFVAARTTPGLDDFNKRQRMRGLRALSPTRTIHLTEQRKVYLRERVEGIRKSTVGHTKGRHERVLTEMTYTRTLKSGKVVQCRRRAQTIIVKPNSPPAISGRSAPVYLPMAPRVIRVEA